MAGFSFSVCCIHKAASARGQARRLKRLVPRLARLLRLRGRLGIAVVGDREIRRLKRRFMGVDRATDVLAFDYREAGELGEVVVSFDRAAAVACRLGKEVEDELALYLVHGVLHLLGFRDDSARGGKRMYRRTNQLLAALGRVPDPEMGR